MATPQTDERATLTLVKDAPEPDTALVVEPRPRPAWMLSGTELKRRIVYIRDNGIDFAIHHSMHSFHYLGWSIRGYRRLCLRWWRARDDDFRQQIASAKRLLRDAKGRPADEAKFKALVDVRRAEHKAHKKRHWIKTGISGFVIVVGTTVGATVGGWWVQLLLALAFIVTGAYFGRPDSAAVAAPQAPTRTSHLGEETMRRVLVEAGAVPEKRAAEVRGVGIPHSEGPGIAYAVHTPSGIPAAVAVGKKQQVASALGVHSDWLDLSVGNVETMLLIWVASEDPFGVVRPSPLLDQEGPVNTFRDGVPVAFGKRGNPITLHVRDTSLIVAGATRRGKGMLVANILIGAAKDPWVNVRIFDGKGVAEHNPYAPILSTFVKRNPERMAIASRIIREEVDRRSDLLDDHGYEKIDDDNYEEAMKLLGGREVFICDELATYTPKGTSPWDDEITENLSQIAAVGAAVGVLLISITQVPEVAVIRGRLRQNHVGRAAMNTESGMASNTILGDGMTGQGYDASRIPLDQPGRFWLATPETGVIQGRSYLVKSDDKRKVVAEAYEMRKAAGRLPGQWRDPIEEQLAVVTGISSAAGGEGGKGRIGSAPAVLTLMDHLIDAATATGRREATRAEVFAYLATVDARYGYRVDETDAQYNSRAGKLLAAAMAEEGLDIKAVKVSTAEEKEARGFRLDDLIDAR
jgi:S-DNA-T family DNA segregation ATPase FtsK/SpoIIIE